MAATVLGNNTSTAMTKCGAFVLLLSIVTVHCAFVLLCTITGGAYYIREEYSDSMKLPMEATKDHQPICGTTTSNMEDLIVDLRNDGSSKTSRRDAYDITMKHGASIIPSLLSKETSAKFREYVMEKNRELDLERQVDALEPDHRYNIMPSIHDDPIVADMMVEVGSNKRLEELLEDVLGPKPTLIGLSVLTAEYGAKGQKLHGDVSASFGSYGDYFVPEYSLLIYLQDTTKDMGATNICPGTQECRGVKGINDLPYYDPSEQDNTDEEFFDTACPLRTTVNQGDALLFQSDVRHRGATHRDPNAMDRSILFLIFSGTRVGPDDDRRWPCGEARALNWRMWGHTFDELATVKEKPWKWYHGFGLFTPSRPLRPWTLFDNFLQIFAEEDEVLHLINNDFDAEYFSDMTDFLVFTTTVASGVYLIMVGSISILCCIFMVRRWVYYDNKKGIIETGENGLKAKEE